MGSEDNFEMFSYVIAELQKLGVGILHLMDGLGFGFHNKAKVFRLADARKLFDGTIIGNCGYEKLTAEGAVGTGEFLCLRERCLTKSTATYTTQAHFSVVIFICFLRCC